jgi:hypothetical protein
MTRRNIVVLRFRPRCRSGSDPTPHSLEWPLRQAPPLDKDEDRCRVASSAVNVDVYGWFTEGFGTTDLKAAKALLDELGGT